VTIPSALQLGLDDILGFNNRCSKRSILLKSRLQAVQIVKNVSPIVNLGLFPILHQVIKPSSILFSVLDVVSVGLHVQKMQSNSFHVNQIQLLEIRGNLSGSTEHDIRQKASRK
jgi:hypothetical protein